MLITFVSILFNSATIALFYGFKVGFPRWTPDIDTFVKSPGPYLRENYWDLLGWMAILLSVSTLGAFLAASPKVANRITNPFMSGWGALIEASTSDSTLPFVGCIMDDGSYVAGYLMSYSRLSDDDADRDIVLTGKITYREPNGDDYTTLAHVEGVVLSARNIVVMTVTPVSREFAEAESSPTIDDSDRPE